MQTSGGKGLRPVVRYMFMMYTDIDFEYHSQLSTTFNLTVNKPIILIHMGGEISIAGPIHIYSSLLLKFHASHGTTRVHH